MKKGKKVNRKIKRKKSKYNINFLGGQEKNITGFQEENNKPLAETVMIEKPSANLVVKKKKFLDIKKDPLIISKFPEKKNINMKVVLFEFLFWGGFAAIIVYFILSSLKKSIPLYVPGIIIGVMVVALIIYSISTKKKEKSLDAEPIQEKSTAVSKTIPIEKSKESAKKENVHKIDKFFSQKREEAKPTEIKKDAILEEKAAAEAVKKEFKRKAIITSALVSFLIIVAALLKIFHMVNIYGISIMVIIVAVIVLVLVQKKKKFKEKKIKGIISNPQPEIEAALKKLKVNETEMDLFYDYIKNKKSVLITTATKDFGFSTEKIEEFGKILESHNLITIYYPAFGPASLKYIEPSKKKEEDGTENN